MKRFLLIVTLLLVAGNVHAAMTCDKSGYVSRSKVTAIYTITCTFDTTPGTAAYTLTEAEMKPMDGAWVTLVTVRPGGTAPDEASVAIADSKGTPLMTAAGNGATLVHATDTLSEYLEGPNGDHYHVADHDNPWMITVTDQATNNAIILIDFELAY
jgi:hypothetical protein